MSRLSGSGTISQEQIAKMVELLQEGMLCAEIARVVGCSRRTVYNYKERLHI